MKPTKKEIKKFADYCEFLFRVSPFVNKKNDIYIYDKLSSYGWNYFHIDDTQIGCFTVSSNILFENKPISITDLMPGYKKFLLLK